MVSRVQRARRDGLGGSPWLRRCDGRLVLGFMQNKLWTSGATVGAPPLEIDASRRSQDLSRRLVEPAQRLRHIGSVTSRLDPRTASAI